MACEISGRSSLSSFQLKLLLVNDFIGSCGEEKMNNPGMRSLNVSVKLGHSKVAAFLDLLSSGNPKQYPDVFIRQCTCVCSTQRKPVLFCKGMFR